MGADCGYVAEGDTKEEVKENMMKHAMEEHKDMMDKMSESEKQDMMAKMDSKMEMM
jgi:predicted small metal-binding protein